MRQSGRSFILSLVISALCSLVLFYPLTAEGAADWSSWKSQSDISLTETVGLNRVNEPVEVTVKLEGAKSDGSDIRVIDDTGIEIPYQIVKIETGSSFTISFFANVPKLTTKTYSVFYNNQFAAKPNYGEINSVVDSNLKQWKTDGVLIQWGGYNYTSPGYDTVTTLKFDNNGDKNPANDIDILCDNGGYYGYLGENISNEPVGFGSNVGQIVKKGPIYTELALGDARFRYYKGQKWILSNNYVNCLFIFDSDALFYKVGAAPEKYVPNLPNEWFNESLNSSSTSPYLAFRHSSNKLVIASVGVNVPYGLLGGRKSYAYDRSFYLNTSTANAKTYWYSDMSGNYEGIENLSKQALNPLKIGVTVKPPVIIDTQPPVTTLVLNGTKATDNWYVSDVTVSLSAVDNEGGVGVDCIEYSFDGQAWQLYNQPLILTGSGEKIIYYRSKDKANNTEVVQFQLIKIDRIAPTTTVNLTGTRGNNDWFTSDVTVTMTAVDNEGGSGVEKTEYSFDGTNWLIYTEPFTINLEGTSSLYYRSTDLAGNIEITVQSDEINVDTNAPVTEAVFNNNSTGNEWASSAGQVILSTSDETGGSGGGQTEYSLDSETWIPYTGPISIDSEGTTTVYYRSVDKAGNYEAMKKLVIKIDKTPPLITGAPSSLPNANGWYNTDVTVHFDASDLVSGLETVTPDLVLADEGFNQFATGTAKDKAGNTAYYTVNNINIDKTPPQVTINLPLEGAEYILGQAVIAEWYAIDNLSGLDSCTGTVSSGELIDTSSVGVKTFVVSAEDKAGNTVTKTVCYHVKYAFTDLLQLNKKVHKLGSTVPVKFRLTHTNGEFIKNVTARLYVTDLTSGTSTELEALSTSSAEPGNLFRYDDLENQYIFNLSTKNMSVGTWQLRISLDDGTSYFSNITLR